jgi:hypothetical protein
LLTNNTAVFQPVFQEGGFVPRPKKEGPPGYEPTVQFRPIPEFAQLVQAFARDHGLALGEAYKDLAALAIIGLDCRYFPLLNQMAKVMGGTNAVVHACLHVHAALRAAARVHGCKDLSEPLRTQFILETAAEVLALKEQSVQMDDLGFLPVHPAPPESSPPESPQPQPPQETPTVRRKVRNYGKRTPAESSAVGSAPEQQSESTARPAEPTGEQEAETEETTATYRPPEQPLPQ